MAITVAATHDVIDEILDVRNCILIIRRDLDALDGQLAFFS